jgi:outer membrane lipoprotein carrier protein
MNTDRHRLRQASHARLWAMRWFGVGVCLVGLLVGSAVGLDGPEVVRRMQGRFAKVQTLSARFEKQHHWQLVDQKTRLKGRLYVEKPGKFRFETDVQTVATDGTTAWNYVPDNEQVLVSGYGKVQEDRSFEKMLFDLILLGAGEYTSAFTAGYGGDARVRGSRCHILVLDAREADRYVSRVRVWVDRKLWLVRRIEYRNINDDVTTYELWDIKVNKELKPSLFTFEPPKGVEVVDLR